VKTAIQRAPRDIGIDLGDRNRKVVRILQELAKARQIKQGVTHELLTGGSGFHLTTEEAAI